MSRSADPNPTPPLSRCVTIAGSWSPEGPFLVSTPHATPEVPASRPIATRPDGISVDAVQVLAAVADLLTPCPAPDVEAGWDLCAHAQTWPCPTTRAAWLARGLTPATQVQAAVTQALTPTGTHDPELPQETDSAAQEVDQ
jgi:hypothetical protein